MHPRFRAVLPLLLATGLLAMLSVACDGDDDDGVADPPEASATATLDDGREGGPEVILEGPASRFAPLLDEIEPGYLTEIRQTITLDPENFSRSGSLFTSPAEGARLLGQWGYEGGFQTGFEPEHRERDVLSGKFYSSIEVHLFAGTDGAHAFYEYVSGRLGAGRAQPISAVGLANESSAWTTVDEAPVPSSDIEAAFHWYLFRRGNMVGFVRTWGAQPLMTIDRARELAIAIDDKALGNREAIVPTPIAFGTPEPTSQAAQ